MNHSQDINEIGAALAKAQGLMSNPLKSTTANSYKYATADVYLDIIRKACSQHELSFTMDVITIDNQHFLTLLLLHSSGQWIKYHHPLRNDHEASKFNSRDQVWGGHLTYMKRQLLCIVFGIHGEEDTDAQPEPAPSKTTPKTEYNVTPQTIEAFIHDHAKAPAGLIRSIKEKNNIEDLRDLPQNQVDRLVSFLTKDT